MCNHYRDDPAWRAATDDWSEIKINPFDISRPRPNTQSHLYPGRTGEIVLAEGENTVAMAAQWRLIPRWFRGSSKEFGNKWRGCNNARSEGITASRMFKDALANRCLIPAGAIFEYAAEPGPDGRKVEFEFTPADGRTLWMAGLYEQSQPSDGPLLTYAMVMTDAGPDARSIGHPRSPIFLDRGQMAAWLDPANDVGAFAKAPGAGFFNLAPAQTKA